MAPVELAAAVVVVDVRLVEPAKFYKMKCVIVVEARKIFTCCDFCTRLDV